MKLNALKIPDDFMGKPLKGSKKKVVPPQPVPTQNQYQGPVSQTPNSAQPAVPYQGAQPVVSQSQEVVPTQPTSPRPSHPQIPERFMGQLVEGAQAELERKQAEIDRRKAELEKKRMQDSIKKDPKIAIPDNDATVYPRPLPTSINKNKFNIPKNKTEYISKNNLEKIILRTELKKDRGDDIKDMYDTKKIKEDYINKNNYLSDIIKYNK